MPKQMVTFHSKEAGLKLIRRPKLEQPLLTGGRQTVQTTVAYKFSPVPSPTASAETKMIGTLTLVVGQDKIQDHEGWLRAGEEAAQDDGSPIIRDAVDALKAHRDFGVQFWVAGHGPGTKYPRPEDVETEVMKAVATLDEQTLVDRLNEERRTHGRVDILAKVEQALKLVRDERASLDAAAAEAEAAKPKATGKPKAPAAA